jgi:hypothetical protein
VLLALCLGAVGCVGRTPPAPQLPFAWEDRDLRGDVAVLPALALHEPLAIDDASFLGLDLPERRLAAREERRRQLLELPEALGWSLPGAVNGRWARAYPEQPLAVTFRSRDWSAPAARRVADAIAAGHGLHDALATLPRSVGGDAVLVTWVDRLSARPLSLDGFPGELVHTAAGPVIVDHAEEPFLVDLRAGMALIAADGEVVMRYQQDMMTVLSATRSPEAVGRELADDLAAEVLKVWRPRPVPASTAHAAP